jgi:adenylyl- and sulfurtransferase ThiI
MLAVLDSGPLTILAAYTMMRRGCMVELLIPSSKATEYFNKERQLQLAAKLRSLVTRSAYKAFIINMDSCSTEYAYAKSRIRNVALQVAKENRFRGVIFSDITGDLNLLSLRDQTAENSMRPAAFYPLLAFGIADLLELGRSVGISESDLLSQITLERESSRYRRATKPGEDVRDLIVEEITL